MEEIRSCDRCRYIQWAKKAGEDPPWFCKYLDGNQYPENDKKFGSFIEGGGEELFFADKCEYFSGGMEAD